MSENYVPVLRLAIQRRDWEAAAVCVLLGVSRAARALPDDGIDEIIAELTSELDAPAHHHKRKGRRSDR
jgi:hypothetical protein